MFPGDSEGLQILEYCMIEGTPTSEDIQKLSTIVERPMIELLKRCGTVKRQEVSKLINPGVYGQEEAFLCGDLIEKMTCWVPWERISAEDALRHPFLAESE
jgi:hypothetical protein